MKETTGGNAANDTSGNAASKNQIGTPGNVPDKLGNGANKRKPVEGFTLYDVPYNSDDGWRPHG